MSKVKSSPHIKVRQGEILTSSHRKTSDDLQKILVNSIVPMMEKSNLPSICIRQNYSCLGVAIEMTIRPIPLCLVTPDIEDLH